MNEEQCQCVFISQRLNVCDTKAAILTLEPLILTVTFYNDVHIVKGILR